MEWTIPEEIIRRTRCDKAFACLADGKEAICTVEFSIGDGVILVRPVRNEPCRHKMFFREAFSCHCPVRKEIYRTYGY